MVSKEENERNLIDKVKKWVSSLNTIESDLIKDAIKNDYDSFIEVTPFTEEEENELMDFLPMWGYLWTFNDFFEEEWCRENLQLVKDIGFRVYRYETTGSYYIGIDGCGYDFYMAHWMPLYKAYFNID